MLDGPVSRATLLPDIPSGMGSHESAWQKKGADSSTPFRNQPICQLQCFSVLSSCLGLSAFGYKEYRNYGQYKQYQHKPPVLD